MHRIGAKSSCIIQFMKYFDSIPSDNSPFLSDGEIMRIVMNFAQTRGEDGITEEEAHEICAWANEVRVGQTMLDMVLEGKVGIDLREDGEVEFSQRGDKDWPIPFPGPDTD